MNNSLYLPDGLPISGFTPKWLGEVWPFDSLTSDVGSIIKMIMICLALAVVSFICMYVAKTFVPTRAGKFISKSLFLLLALAILAGGAMGVTSWKKEYKVSDYEMGVQVSKVMDYIKVNGASIDNRTAWDLTCAYYDNPNANCRDNQHSAVRYKERTTKVKLQKSSDGKIEVQDYEKLLPLF